MKKYEIIQRILLIIVSLYISSFAGEFIECEALFIRGTGKPETKIETFSVFNPDQMFYVKVHNGPEGHERVSSATVSILLNGDEIFTSSDFNQQIEWLYDTLNLNSENTIEVQVTSKPGSALKIIVYGIDNNKPHIQFLSPLDNTYLNTTQPEVNITYSDLESGIILSSFQIWINGIERSEFFNVTEDKATWNIPPEQSLPEGNNIMIAQISDRGGNIATDTVIFIVDTKPPVVVIISPADGFITNQTPVNIIWKVDGEEQTTQLTEDLVEGENTIIRSATDNAGNVGVDSIKVTLDTEAPVVVITSPTDGFIAHQTPVDVTWTVDGEEQTEQLTEDLVEGENTIIRYATDAAGNTGSDTVNVILVTTGPLVEIASPVNGFVSAVNEVTFTVNSLFGPALSAQFFINDIDYTGSFVQTDLTFAANVPLADGHYTFRVFAENQYGRKDTTRISFKVNTTPPETQINIRGKVVNGKSNSPIEGATVTVIEMGSAVTTNSDGDFLLPSGGYGDYKVSITHSDYTSAIRFVSASPGLDVTLPPVILVPHSTETATVPPLTETTVSLQDNAIEIHFPENATSEALEVSATLYDDIEQLPNEQPNMDMFLFCVDLQPHNKIFSEPVTVSVPNANNLTAGAEVPITYFNETTGEWEDVGIGHVTEDGESITFETTHFCVFHGNWHPAFLDWLKSFGANMDGLPNNGYPSKCKTLPIGSEVTVTDGDLNIDYTIPGGAALTDISVSLQYWTSTASPFQAISSHYENFLFSPTYISWTIYLPSLRNQWLFHGSNQPTGLTYIWGGLNNQGDLLPTGVYPYGIRSTDILMPGRYRYDFNQAENLYVSFVKPTTIKNYYYGFLTLINRTLSPYGAGWTIGGVTRIIEKKGELTETFPKECVFRNVDDDERRATFNGEDVVSGIGAATALGNTKGTLAGKHVAIVGAGPAGTIYWHVEGSNTYEPPHGSHDTLVFTDPGWRRTFEDGTVETYNEHGLLVRRENRKGFATLYEYDSFNERLLRIIDEQTGNMTELLYDSRDVLSGIRDQYGRVTEINIDNSGNLISIVTADDIEVRQFDYDEDHRMVSKTYAGGELCHYTYNDYGAVIQTVNTDSLITEFDRSSDKAVINGLEKVADGVIEGFLQNPTGTVPDYSTQPIHPFPQEGQAGYVTRNNLGEINSYTFNSYGMLSSETNARGETVKYGYTMNSCCGDAHTTEYPNGLVVTRENDEKGNVQRIHNSATDAETRYTYITINGTDYVDSIYNPLGQVTRFVYDQVGNVTMIIAPGNDTTIMTYNSLHLPETVTDPLGRVVRMEYDSLGRLSSKINPNGDTTIYNYGPYGNLLSVIDPEGRETEYEYDIMGRLIREIDPAENIIRYVYNQEGRLDSIIDPKGHATTFTYDPKGRLSRTTNHLGYSREYSYDAGGKLTQFINARNQTITYTYDELQRLINKHGPDNEELARFAYDRMGNMVYASNPDYVIRRQYDLASRMVQEEVFSVVTNDTIVESDTITADDFSRDYTHLLVDGTELTIDGTHNFLSLTLINNATVKHLPTTIDEVHKLQIFARDSINIEAGSKIDVTGLGYAGGQRNGNTTNTGVTNGNSIVGGSSPGSGGSHGGRGGAYLYKWHSWSYADTIGVAALTYGDRLWPTQPGGGGGGRSPGGHNGGGVVHLNAPRIVVNGTIRADGENVGPLGTGGAGAGGSVIIETEHLAGTGEISANGGNGLKEQYSTEGGGGGGRILIKTTIFEAIISSASGGSYGGNDGTLVMIGPDGEIIEERIIKDCDTIVISEDNETWDGDMLFLDNARVTINGYHSFRSVVLRNGSIITHSPISDSSDIGLILNVRDFIIIDSTSRIDANGKGYAAGYLGSCARTEGFRCGASGLSGGSYGGLGGEIEGFAPSVYGSIIEPVEFGSGGANDSIGYIPSGDSPELLYPKNDTTFEACGVYLSWMPGRYNHHFTVLLDTNPLPLNPVSENLNTNHVIISSFLDFDSKYYWRVIGFDFDGNGDTSEVWSFSTGSIPPLIEEGLVAYYPFNGNANDESGNGHNGTPINGAALCDDRNGNPSQAFNFDGIDDYINLGVWNTGNRWSLSAWVKPTLYKNERTTIVGNVMNCVDWAIGTHNNKFCVIYRPPSACTQSLMHSEEYALDQWYHIAGTYDGTFVRLYINGVFIDSALAANDYHGSHWGMWIGAEYCCTSGKFAGAIDEVQVYNRTLDNDEIKAISGRGDFVEVPPEMQKFGTGGGHIEIITPKLSVNGFIQSNGESNAIGGAGSGGSILIVSDTIIGSGRIIANGGSSLSGGGGGGGRIALLETKELSFTLDSITSCGGYGQEIGEYGTIYSSLSDTIIVRPFSFNEHSAITITDKIIILDEEDYSLDGTFLKFDNCTVKLKGRHVFLGLELHNSSLEIDNDLKIVQSLSLKDNSTISQVQSTILEIYKTVINVQGSIYIDSSSSIDVSGCGYVGNQYIDGSWRGARTINNDTGSTDGAGGSYGGRGGHSGACLTYGDFIMPDNLGSGGSAQNTRGRGGDGGGFVSIQSPVIHIDGSILAKGDDGYTMFSSNLSLAGGGSGGGILIVADSIYGTGLLSASGGNGYYSEFNFAQAISNNGGGGGRIAFHITDYFGLNRSQISAKPGNGGIEGSIAIVSGEGDSAIVTIQDTWLQLSEQRDFGKFIAKNSKIVFVNDSVTFDNLLIIDSSTVTHEKVTVDKEYGLALRTYEYLLLDSTSKIDVSGCGYVGDQYIDESWRGARTIGNVTGSIDGAGGSYGGRGGRSGACPTYGDFVMPGELGSGGSAQNIRGQGGNGGGFVSIQSPIIQLYGSIIADGDDGHTNYSPGLSLAGGGSGGGILIAADSIYGNGFLSANGGDGYYSQYNFAQAIGDNGGGGGRIAIHVNDYLGINSSQISVSPGNGGIDGSITIVSEKEDISVVTIQDTWLQLSEQRDFGKFVAKNSKIVFANDSLTFDSLLIIDSSVVTHKKTTVNEEYGLVLWAYEYLLLDNTSIIDVSGLGYVGDQYLDGVWRGAHTIGNDSGSTDGAGGSYGGKGGRSGACLTYGDFIMPGELGSGGSAQNIQGRGGDGGGFVSIQSPVIHLDGSIIADGKNGHTYNSPGLSLAGGGSGGGILIVADSVYGNGLLSAKGGDGYYSQYNYAQAISDNGGGGGRIALHTSEYFGLDSTRISVLPGNGGTEGSITYAFEDENFSVIAIQDTWLRLSERWNFRKFITKNSKMVFANDSITFDSLLIIDNSIVTHEKTSADREHRLILQVYEYLFLDSTSLIDVTGSGYLGDRYIDGSWRGARTTGNDSGSTDGAGGSYGGNGGRSGACLTYGDFIIPRELGSGGSCGPYSCITTGAIGGNGGGFVQISTSAIQLDGAVFANGMDGVLPWGGCYSVDRYVGGGSGGGITIIVDSIFGSGKISANGGTGYQGRAHYSTDIFPSNNGGGGGRVSLFAALISDSLQITAFSGQGGAPGTIFIRDSIYPLGKLIVDNNGQNAPDNSTPLPAIGEGIITAMTADSMTDANATFGPFLKEHLLRLNYDLVDPGNTFIVVSNNSTTLVVDTLKRTLFDEGAVGDPYIGVFAFDSIIVKGGARVTTDDLIFYDALELDNGVFTSFTGTQTGMRNLNSEIPEEIRLCQQSLYPKLKGSFNHTRDGDKTTFRFKKEVPLHKLKSSKKNVSLVSNLQKINKSSKLKYKAQTIYVEPDNLQHQTCTLIKKSKNSTNLVPDLKQQVSLEKEKNTGSKRYKKSTLIDNYQFVSRFTYEKPANNNSTNPDKPIQLACTGTDPIYTYDKLGRRISMTDPLGTTHYTYDTTAGHLSTITDRNGREFRFSYEKGQLTGIEYPNGITSDYTFDNNGNLESLVYSNGASTVASYSYDYDRNGMRTAMTDLEGVHSYTYDQLYQIIEATHPSPTMPMEKFKYDPAGNRLHGLDSNFIWQYDELNHLLEDNTYTYDYDADGNMILKVDKTTNDSTIYTYDIENRLVVVSKPGISATFTYGPLGRRLRKEVNGVAKEFRYDGENMLLELDDNDSITAAYTFGPGIDWPLEMERDNQDYYYLVDGLGSVTTITNNSGTIAQTYKYSVFGEIIEQTGDVENAFTYTSREWDDEIGLYYYRARFYDARVGRFLSEDPIGVFEAIKNRYILSANDPIDFLDPFGLFKIGATVKTSSIPIKGFHPWKWIRGKLGIAKDEGFWYGLVTSRDPNSAYSHFWDQINQEMQAGDWRYKALNILAWGFVDLVDTWADPCASNKDKGLAAANTLWEIAGASLITGGLEKWHKARQLGRLPNSMSGMINFGNKMWQEGKSLKQFKDFLDFYGLWKMYNQYLNDN